jgi:hypothetical protein
MTVRRAITPGLRATAAPGGRAAAPPSAGGAGPAHFLDLSDSEIAADLGISRGTVASTASRALAALARKTGEQA